MRFVILPCIGVLLFFGCGGRFDDEPERRVLYGRVTYDGTPVEKGEIRLIPAEGVDAPTAGGLIENGRYRIGHKGGAPVGTFQVILSAYQAAGSQDGEIPGAAPDDPMAARDQILPAKYSSPDSELTLTIELGTEEIEHNFELEQ